MKIIVLCVRWYLRYSLSYRDDLGPSSISGFPVLIWCLRFESAKAIPRVHKAERLARGVKVLDTEPVSNPGSTQGGATWNVTVYHPSARNRRPIETPETLRSPRSGRNAHK